MILLDTNVISEPLKAVSDQKVIAWINAQNIETLYLSAIGLAELRFGIAVIPEGKRKDMLHTSLEKRILPLFEGRILPFETGASQAYAILRSKARMTGKTIAPADGYIAAIAVANGLSIATRDTKPFMAAGLAVINPWQPD